MTTPLTGRPRRLLRLLLALLLALSLSHSSCASASRASTSSAAAVAVAAAAAGPAPYDPRDFTMALSNEERAYRAANTPGGEVSFCCCYCGRGGADSPARPQSAEVDRSQQPDAEAAEARQHQAEQDEDAAAAGIASEDAWLYAALPSQPRAESGDPTDRLAQRRRRRTRQRRQQRRRKQRKQRGHRRIGGASKGHSTSGGLNPLAADGGVASSPRPTRSSNSSLSLPLPPARVPVEDQPASSLASFSIYPSLESGCDNEGCAESSALCRSSHLWTGWAGDFGLATSSSEAVRAKCRAIYAREMEVLNEFNKIMEREMAPAPTDNDEAAHAP